VTLLPRHYHARIVRHYIVGCKMIVRCFSVNNIGMPTAYRSTSAGVCFDPQSVPALFRVEPFTREQCAP
jgi:hypothetical protein